MFVFKMKNFDFIINIIFINIQLNFNKSNNDDHKKNSNY